jgi:hypothetical protein
MDYYNAKEMVRGALYVGNVSPQRAIDYVADVVAALAANGHEDPANAKFSEAMWDEMEFDGRIPSGVAYTE